MGCWFLTSFVGNTIAGFLGGKYEEYSPVILFGMLAGIAFITGIILLFLIPKLNNIITDKND